MSRFYAIAAVILLAATVLSFPSGEIEAKPESRIILNRIYERESVDRIYSMLLHRIDRLWHRRDVYHTTDYENLLHDLEHQLEAAHDCYLEEGDFEEFDTEARDISDQLYELEEAFDSYPLLLNSIDDKEGNRVAKVTQQLIEKRKNKVKKQKKIAIQYY